MKENYHLTIKKLPQDERPYEKLEKYGAEMLTNAELLAIIIKTGTKDETSVCLAQKIIKSSEQWVEHIANISIGELTKIRGIGRVKAIQIKAVFELGKRFSAFKRESKIQIKTPQDVYNLLIDDMRFLKKEHVKALLLDIKNQLIKITDISIGSLNASIIHPREVFVDAIKYASASLILVHNHPSGDPTPSKEDINVTERIAKSGQILGIELLDHIILGAQNFVSFKEKNII